MQMSCRHPKIKPAPTSKSSFKQDRFWNAYTIRSRNAAHVRADCKYANAGPPWRSIDFRAHNLSIIWHYIRDMSKWEFYHFVYSFASRLNFNTRNRERARGWRNLQNVRRQRGLKSADVTKPQKPKPTRLYSVYILSATFAFCAVAAWQTVQLLFDWATGMMVWVYKTQAFAGVTAGRQMPRALYIYSHIATMRI